MNPPSHKINSMKTRKTWVGLGVVMASATVMTLASPVTKAGSNLAPPARVPVCHSFGCKYREVVSLADQEWREVSGWFSPAAASAADERTQIRKAIGWMEVVVGRYTPTHKDRGGNLPVGAEQPGQLDCVDESKNTTTYLRLFERHGLLRWHRVVERAYRRAIVDEHWSGQIEEIETGERWIVDSWFQNNGYLPHVEKASEWRDIPFFSSAYDPHHADKRRSRRNNKTVADQ